jgi:cytoskeletal protein CcmA (bactofilin family)
MFKSKKHEINPSATDTLVGEGSVFEGRIKSEASIRIEGHLTGDIECAGDVTIGEKGAVRSNISAREVIIAGQVNGNVTTKGRLTIMATGQLTGNTNSASFVIEEGGIFHGTSKMDKNTGSAQGKGAEHGTGGAAAGSGFGAPNGGGGTAAM